MDFRTLDQDVADAALVDLVQELRERDVLGGGVLAGVLKQREQRKQQQDNDDPQGEIAQIGVHFLSLPPDRAYSGDSILPADRGGFTFRYPGNVGATPPPAKGTPFKTSQL